MGPRPSKNGYSLCRIQDISNTIISKEERVEWGRLYNQANHMLWGLEWFY